MDKVARLAEQAEALGYVLVPANEYYALDLIKQNQIAGAWHRGQRATGKPVNPPPLDAGQMPQAQPQGRSRP